MKAGRPRAGATGLSLLLALATLLAGCSSAGTTEPGAGTAPPSATAVAGALHRLERALRAGDGPAAARLAAAPADAEVAVRLAALADNAGSLHLTGLRVGAADAGADPRWVTVAVRWRVPGVDPEPLTSTLRLRVVAAGPEARVSALEVDGQAPLWLQGPVSVARSGDVVVVAAGGGSDARSLLGEAEAASRTVRRVLPGWAPRLAVEAPSDVASYAAVLDVAPGERAGDAAVTTTLGDPATSRSLRVVLNPEVYAGQGRRGERVVLAHEATHVALRAAASDLPLWLVEGFADYVALRDVRVPARRSAADLTAWVRRHGPLPSPPGDGWFASSDSRLAVAYEASWLACVAVAERVGERGLVRLYRRAARTHDPVAALRQVAGLSPRRLARAVTDRVSHWAA